MSPTISKLTHLRTVLLLGSKLTGIVLCIYFIKNANDYSISWSLFTWLVPSVGITISSLLSSIGTYILIIPFTILLTSLLMPENKILAVISSLLGGASLLIAGLKFLTFKEHAQAINFKLFSVTKTITLGDKREIFITEYKRLALDNYFHLKETYDFLMQRLTTQYLTKYDEFLHHLQQSSEIKQYAFDLVTSYAASVKPISFSIPWKSIIIISGFAITIIAIVVLANRISIGESNLVALAEKTEELSKFGSLVNGNVLQVADDCKKLATNTSILGESLRTVLQKTDKFS